MSGDYMTDEYYWNLFTVEKLEKIVNDSEENGEYPKDIIVRLKDGLDIVKAAGIFIRRIDYLISGDDSEEEFKKRLSEEIQELSDRRMHTILKEIEKENEQN